MEITFDLTRLLGKEFKATLLLIDIKDVQTFIGRNSSRTPTLSGVYKDISTIYKLQNEGLKLPISENEFKKGVDFEIHFGQE